ncbi:MAG: nitronate monooxygenase [Ginsengibacter sp.]
MFSNRITQLFNIDFPIVQAGMVWASGWRLASAVSNAGALGILGAGSMSLQVLAENIEKYKAATDKPFGVNIPLLYSGIEEQIELIIRHEVKIVVTSAGNPSTYTQHLRQHGITVVHVVSSGRFAKKAEAAGCDAIIAEGFEAGGHNGREETTTLVLLPLVCDAVKIPVIAAGGIATGRQMLACMILGAEGVQMGSRFVASEEASSHSNFKNAVISANEGDTMVTLKELTPVRMIKNDFYEKISQAQKDHASVEQLQQILGRGRAKKGMFEGELSEGELEIGQVSAYLKDIKPAAKIVRDTWLEFNEVLKKPLK